MISHNTKPNLISMFLLVVKDTSNRETDLFDVCHKTLADYLNVFFFYPNCCSVQTWSWVSRPRLFTRLLSELGLLSELILSVMTSDRHHFILHYPIDATSTKAALLSLPALNHWLAGTIPCDVYRTITLPEEHLTVSQRFMQLLKPWQCKLRQIDRQEVTIITKWVKKNNKVQFIINMTHNVT